MSKIIPQRIDNNTIVDKSSSDKDVEVEVKRIENQQEEIIKAENPNKGLTSIAYAKRADNSKNAQYYANFVKDSGLTFGIAVTKSI